METAKEQWKDIKGFEGLYQISNFGNVKSLERIVKYCENSKAKIKQHTVKAKMKNLTI